MHHCRAFQAQDLTSFTVESPQNASWTVITASSKTRRINSTLCHLIHPKMSTGSFQDLEMIITTVWHLSNIAVAVLYKNPGRNSNHPLIVMEEADPVATNSPWLSTTSMADFAWRWAADPTTSLTSFLVSTVGYPNASRSGPAFPNADDVVGTWFIR